MQQFSQEIPWVLLQENTSHGWQGAAYDMSCEVCGARSESLVRFMYAERWAEAHRTHQAPQGSLRLGDAFAAVAKPIARAVGIDPNCTPCEARRRAMNDLKRLW